MADMSNAFRDVGAAAVHAGAELERAFTAFGQVIVDAVEPDFALDEAAVQAVSQAIADQNEQRVRELLTMAQTPVLTHAEKRLLMGLDPEPPRAPGRRAINFQLE